jgi:molecular chaperone GrpE (heat shock protein)
VRKKEEEHTEEHTEERKDHIAELKEMVHKLTRMQYKTNQDMLGKLDRLSGNMEDLQQRQSAQDETTGRLQHNVEMAGAAMIGLLDDLDYLISGKQAEGTADWNQVFLQWRGQLLDALETLGIRELRLVGRSFDPRLAEGVQAVSLEEWVMKQSKGADDIRSYAAYEILEIVKRGFVRADGTLLRKAQVITLKEGKSNE